MNGCIFFNRSYTRWQHALVLDLKNHFGVKNWCGYLYGKAPYKIITQQKDILYSPLLVDEFLAVKAREEIVDEGFLKAKEKEYGTPFLWQTFTSDRIMSMNWPRNFYSRYDPIFNHDDIKRQLQIRIKVIEKMLKEARSDFVIFSGAGAMGVNLLFHIASKHNIKCINFDSTRVRSMTTITESLYGNLTAVEEKFRRVRRGSYKSCKRKEAIQFIEEFREKPTKPYWVNLREQRLSMDFVLFIKSIAGIFLEYFDRSFPKIYSYGLAVYLKRNFLTWFNMHKKTNYDAPDPKEDYAFFPLSYEPEISLLMFAPFYTDQLWLIRNIAQSLPIHFKLYVKEHPSMLGLRKPVFYKELRKIPNIKFIDINTDSTYIVKNAKLITVITGTVGLEGALLRKPVISFGSFAYNALSMVRRCKIIDELPLLVKECLENFEYNEDEMIDFVSCLLEDSFYVNFEELIDEPSLEKIMARPEIRKLSESIIKFMSVKPYNYDLGQL